jgi:amino acid transporter
VDWFVDTISAHLFLVFLVPLAIGLAVLLVRDQLLRSAGVPREEWPRVFTHRTITPARNKLGFFFLCICGLARILMGLFEEHNAFGKLVYVIAGLALILIAFFVYRKTQRDIERAVTTPIDPNHPSGGAT